ncbi:hemerythrin domain-containing protein [Longitalea luteola]|uniref:hemerythrin domain-containing protein n=1 Tax=Longitalea luteola TaxID=2812563 RepID=UPI001A96A96A|nr:hemerythrin domain-containing protein [Longitalea luteola]
MEHAKALQVLSRQHKEDRLKCREFLKDIQQQRDKSGIRQRIVQFWKNELQKHVDAEEAILFPFLQKHHFPFNFVNILKREHDTIRLLAERLHRQDEDYYLYNAFVKLVDQHSHFEDEIIFRKMEEVIPPQELSQLNVSMAAVAR